MGQQDAVGLAMARMLNGEIATPELLSVVTGLSRSEVKRRAEQARDNVLGGDGHEALNADDVVALTEENGDSTDPEVTAFLESIRRPS